MIPALLLIPFFIVPLYVLQPATFYTGTPRYLLTTYPLLVIGVSALIPRGRFAVPVAVALVTLSAVTCLGFFVTDTPRVSLETRTRNFNEVASWLGQNDDNDVCADYWTAMPLEYLAGDSIYVAVYRGTKRFPDEQRHVAAAPHVTYVGYTQDGTADQIRTALQKRGISSRSTTIGDFVVFDRISSPDQPQQIGL